MQCTLYTLNLANIIYMVHLNCDALGYYVNLDFQLFSFIS